MTTITDDELRARLNPLPRFSLVEIIIMVSKGHDLNDVLWAAEINYETDMYNKFVNSGRRK